MQKLFIKITSVKYIDPGALCGLVSLDELYMCGSNLRKMPDLSSVGHSLKKLMLNEFRNEDEGTHNGNYLEYLVVLETLRLTRSGLTGVPKDIRHVAASLRLLFLMHNNISALNNMYNVIFHNLEHLDLAYNSIYHLHPDLLRFPILSRLNLRFNKLTQLPDLSFSMWGIESQEPGYRLLNVEYNPLHYNGSMDWLRSSLCRVGERIFHWGQGLMIDVEYLSCHSPRDVQRTAALPVDKLVFQTMKTCGKHDSILMISFVYVL